MYKFQPFAIKRDQTFRFKVLKNKMAPQNIVVKSRMLFNRIRRSL